MVMLLGFNSEVEYVLHAASVNPETSILSYVIVPVLSKHIIDTSLATTTFAGSVAMILI